MITLPRLALLWLCISKLTLAHAQDATPINYGNPGRFSFGFRSTLSAFGNDGIGLGTGGQFRIQLSKRVNTDWFADYIMVDADKIARSEYYHIGWSVMFYLLDDRWYPKTLQPFVLAGHCFDYNKKTLISNEDISKERWGSAVQAGVGTHINISPRLDLTLMTQYMIHLTGDFDVIQKDGVYDIVKEDHSILEGHLLTTAGLNYKLFRLWGRK